MRLPRSGEYDDATGAGVVLRRDKVRPFVVNTPRITMNSAASQTRRGFLKTSAAALSVPAFIPASALGRDGRPAPGSRIVMGAIGLGGRGMSVMRDFLRRPEVQMVALCDVQSVHWRDGAWGKGRPRYGRDIGRQAVEEHYARNKPSGQYRGCETYQDFRNLCARKDLDAVIVATPDHWHALQCLEAIRNGKDVYCEKPLTHYFREGQLIYREVARHGRIFQVGSQQRSYWNFRQAVEIVRNGLIGKVKRVEVGLPTGHDDVVVDDTEMREPPANLDYESWCGPSKKLPYIFARHHRNWRWNLAYGGGQLMDWIGHHNDIAHWGLGLDHTGPLKVAARDWTWPTRTKIYDAPVDYEVVSHYAGGLEIVISSRLTMGTKWIGSDGWVYVNRGKLDASNKQWIKKGFEAGRFKAYRSDDHTQNFLDGVKTRKPCICPAETGHRSITPGHLGAISARVGRPLKWDPKSETIQGDAEASRLLEAHYRYPWVFA